MRVAPLLVLAGCWTGTAPATNPAPAHDPDPRPRSTVQPHRDGHWTAICGDTQTGWREAIEVELELRVEGSELVGEGSMAFAGRFTNMTLRGPDVDGTTLTGEIVEVGGSGTQWDIELIGLHRAGATLSGRFLEVTGSGRDLMCDFVWYR